MPEGIRVVPILLYSAHIFNAIEYLGVVFEDGTWKRVRSGVILRPIYSDIYPTVPSLQSHESQLGNPDL